MTEKITVKQHPDFNPEFPETFPWGKVDQITLSETAARIASWIATDLRAPERHLVPGLRQALRIIAELAYFG